MRTLRSKRGVQLLLLIGGYFLARKLGTVLRSSLWRGTCHSSIADRLSESQHVHPRDSRPAIYDDTVMIGVMTSRGNLTFRAATIFNTWGQEVSGRLLFYVGRASQESADVSQRVGSDDTQVPPGSEPIKIIRGLPVVELTDVDDVVSPPRQKSLAMLRHMHQHFGRHFRWFVRVDDDVYVHYKKLTQFLLSLDDSLPWYITRAKRETPQSGKPQGSTGSQPHCPGRPLIVFSSTSLRLLVPHLPQCHNTSMTSQDDLDLGECIQVHLRLTCASDSKIQALFLQSTSTQHPDKKKASWATKEKASWATKEKASWATKEKASWATKEQQLMWDVHQAAQRLQLRNLQSRMEELDEERREMDGMAVDTGLPGHVTAHGGRPRDQRSHQNVVIASPAVRGKETVITQGKEGLAMETRVGREVRDETVWQNVGLDRRLFRFHLDKEISALVAYLSQVSPQFRVRLEEGFGDVFSSGQLQLEKLFGEATHPNKYLPLEFFHENSKDMEPVLAYSMFNDKTMTNTPVAIVPSPRQGKMAKFIYQTRHNENARPTMFRQEKTRTIPSVHYIIRQALQSHRELVAFRRLSVQGGLQHLISVSTSKGFQSFRIQAPLGELTWWEDCHRGKSVLSGDRYAELALQRQFKQKETITSKLHQEGRSVFMKSSTDILKPLWPKLHILLPLKGRHQSFLEFVENLSKIVPEYAGEVGLYVALFTDSRKEYELSSDVSQSTSVLTISVFQVHGEFSRSLAFNSLSVLFDNSSILVLMDVDMVLTDQFLYRVAFNVGPNTAYAPIVFSTYSPDTVCYGRPRCSPSPFDFSKDSGLWRDFGYGMIALRAEDYRKCGGMDNTIIGWGTEDQNFVERCIREGIIIIRSRDPGLTHVYHDKVCDPHLPEAQLRPCYGSKWALYGSTGRLAQMVMDMEENGTL